MNIQTGVVTRGINNIYAVVPLEQLHELGKVPLYSCRIKGKVLQGVAETYSPLAVGDRVTFVAHQGQEGMILERLPRENSFDRWNAKREVNQTLVANMDLIICVTSTDDPPFRPRFIDRAIVCAHYTPVLIVLNKCDLMLTEFEDDRFQLYKKLGFDTFSMSAFDEAGVVALRKIVEGKVVALIGQSGVGKSTLVNALLGGKAVQKVGEISQKFHRGRHTTNHALMLNANGFIIVDTPGMRELLIPHEGPLQIAEGFPEFSDVAGSCSFQPCTHYHEPHCAVKDKLAAGLIDTDRYESYIRMLDSLDERPESWESDRR